MISSLKNNKNNKSIFLKIYHITLIKIFIFNDLTNNIN